MRESNEHWAAARRAGVILLALAAAGPLGATDMKLIEVWDASNESSSDQFDHAAWQEILDAYLRVREQDANRFDYQALKASAEDSRKLSEYLERLQAVDPREYSRAEQKAYWINFYNALTVQTVLEEYPVNSIRNISRSLFGVGGLIPLGPWGDERATVAGVAITLDNIENGIMRPIYQDARVHYALNCASVGCPDLAPQAYTAANMEQLLEAGARNYVNDPRGVDFVDEDFIVLSSIYDWYLADYGGTEESVMEHLARYADAPLKERLAEFAGAVEYDYNWDLNAP